MPNQKSLRMEDMSEAFLRALCAANGYSISITNHDNDGLDGVKRGIVYSRSSIYMQIYEKSSKIPNATKPHILQKGK